MVSGLDLVKIVDICLEMAKSPPQRRPEIRGHFHLSGEEKLENVIRKLAKNLNIDQQVSFHGHRMDIKGCIFGLDAVVLCSDHEGLPMTVLECLAVGTPLIAHSTGGLTDLLKSNSDSLVVNHTATDYAERVFKLFINKHVRITFPDKFCIEKVA